MNKRRFPHGKHAFVISGGAQPIAPVYNTANYNVLSVEAKIILDELRSEEKEIQRKKEEEEKKQLEEREALRIEEAKMEEARRKEEDAHMEILNEYNLYLARLSIGSYANIIGIGPRYYTQEEPMKTLGGWQAIHADLVRYHDLSDQFITFERCHHRYRVKRGGKLERILQNNGHAPGGCLVCAKLSILPVDELPHLIFEHALRTSGIFGFGTDYMPESIASEVICCLDRVYHHLYCEGAILTFEEWESVKKGRATREDIVAARNNAQRVHHEIKERKLEYFKVKYNLGHQERRPRLYTYRISSIEW